MLELAAGPADHAREFARRGIPATALDLSAAMCASARTRATGLPLQVVQADMTDFDLPHRFDLALLMLDSAALLLTDEAMTGFLTRTAEHLAPAGLLIVDLAAPAGADPDWTIGDVRTRWGSPQDVHDQVTGIRQVRVRISVAHETVVDTIIPARPWTAAELTRLTSLEPIARYGSMTADLPATDPRAHREILILRRPA
ncbi:class I SAM-dependent methyltransferase [Actinoplanes sp. NPDC049596]|uniref:class I SAM-dependent methyltransferase n=1 Tax=unclassified Actinoplanes TaxID=2626549 RepID=UPI003413F1C9